ncbi:MAG: hypothetical protein EXR71_06885 [Myxococcales bacterium]|nr:hypothetical protein [Myxococcales bacterium]
MQVDPTEPERIGRWRVLRTIARGGMATVYAVVDPESGERFAIKLLTQPGASVQRLLQEYQSLARIDHPNVVRVYQFGATDEQLPFVVMELLDGVQAQVRVKATGRPGEPVRTSEAARIARDIALALGHLHARGIVHRDLKSSNVLVLSDGTAKLLDFGTARLVHAYDPITQLGEFVGTFAYASPEQLTGGAVDARSDLYSLGVLLFRMLCGRRPFEGDNPVELARNHLDLTPPDPAVLAPNLPRPLADLALRMLAKLPADRPQDARSVAEALAPFVSEPGSRGLGHAPLLGRDQAFAEAQRFLAAAEPGSALFVAANPGHGRRTFIELVAQEAFRRGARVIALGGGDDAFRRLVWAVQDLRGESAGDGIDRDPTTPSPVPEAIRSVGRLLASRALAEKKVAVLAAPSFWALAPPVQEAVLGVLRAAGDLGGPVLLVAATGSVSPTLPGSSRVPLRALTGSEAATVAAHWLGVASIPPELARRLVKASGGLPGPLTELVRALPAALPTTPIVIPFNLRDEALTLIDAVSPADRRLLEAIALADHELDSLRAAWLVDQPEARTKRRLAALAATGVVTLTDGFWGLRDGLVAELLRRHTAPPRRHLLHRRLAAIAEDLPPSEAVADACHVAGKLREAAEIAVRWAWPLVRAGSWGEAFPLLERLAAANPELEAAVGVRFWTLYGECLAELQMSPVAANYALGRASALAQNASDSAEVELAASRLARARSDPQAERSLLQTAIARLDAAAGPPDRRAAEGRAHLADLLVRSGDLPGAVFEAGLALRGGSDDLTAYATTLGYALLAAGSLGDAELTFRAAESEARVDGKNAWRALAGLVVVLGAQGRFSEAGEIGEAAERAARAGAPGHRLAALQLALVEVDVSQWRHGLARKRLDQALDALHGDIPARLEARVALLRARLAWDGGDAEAAVRWTEDALTSPGVAVARGGAAEVRAARGVFLCASGHPDVGWIDLAAALGTLIEMRALGALARVAELATYAVEDAALVEPIWSPLTDWLTAEPARPSRVARALNRLRFVRARGWDDTEARMELRTRWLDLTSQLVATDCSAMQAHPWARIASGR